MAARLESSFNSILEWASFNNLHDIAEVTKKVMAQHNVKENASDNRQIPLKEAFDILKVASEAKIGPEGHLTKLLSLVIGMEQSQKDKISDIDTTKWFGIKRLIINQIAICKMMDDFTVTSNSEDFFQIPPDFAYPEFKANLTRFFDDMKAHYPFEEGESEEHSIDVEAFTKNLITKTNQGNFFSKKRVLHLLQMNDHKKFCLEVTDFLKQLENEQPQEVEVVLKYILPQQDEANGKRQRVV